MPIYEYSCEKCGNTIEVIQKFSDKHLRKHEGCGGKLTKLISAAAFQFKGTGWYVTDYARKSSRDGTEAAKDAAKDAKTSGNGSKDVGAEKKSTASTNTGKTESSSKSSGS